MTTIEKNKRLFEDLGVTEEFREALEAFIDGTNMRTFNREFRKILRNRMLASLEDGLLEDGEIEVFKDMGRLSELLDVMESQYGPE